MPTTYEPIDTRTLDSNQASITFSNISQAYTDLVILFAGKTNSTSNAYDALKMRFNGDSSAVYSTQNLLGNGSVASAERYSNLTHCDVGRISSDNNYSGFDSTMIHINDYSNTTTHKTILTRSNAPQEFYKVSLIVSSYRSTAAISNILIFPAVASAFKTGTSVTLYGILKA
jgi:hypothetical protein